MFFPTQFNFRLFHYINSLLIKLDSTNSDHCGRLKCSMIIESRYEVIFIVFLSGVKKLPEECYGFASHGTVSMKIDSINFLAAFLLE